MDNHVLVNAPKDDEEDEASMVEVSRERDIFA